MTSRSLYYNASFNWKIFFGIVALAMIGVSAYMVNHYYESLYPTGVGGSFCNISTWLNCDVTMGSIVSNIYGVPIALFGMMVGVFFLLGFFLPKQHIEGTNHFIAILNFAGCLILFCYSIFWLKGLCPMCFAYYVASGLALLCFYKTSSFKKPHLKVLVAYALITAIPAWLVFADLEGRKDKNEQYKVSLMKEYDRLKNVGDPDTPSQFVLERSFNNFSEAPVRMSIFSDFQCPSCKKIAHIGEELAKKYRGKINIQYFFFPLDNDCNPEIKRALHTFACRAAYLAACAPPEKFLTIHDHIFENQAMLSANWLSETAKTFGVSDCYEKSGSKDKVMTNFNNYKKYKIQSTPTVILNGKKIEGAIPQASFEIIIDELLIRAGQ